MHNFRNLKVWEYAFSLVTEVYLETKSFPKEEVFSLTTQIRRCAVSIPSNIAEGCGRGTNKQLSHFLDISQGSACELETQLLLAARLNYLSESKCKILIDKVQEVQRMIRGFKKTLR
jgi:four helix bundle protein